ncbi:MAG: hypothetical protein WKG07_14590 [Hymenobacter sp.]
MVQRLVGIMSDRARDEVRGQERDDKLRALGKLSAGLAHELNNPAAAIARAADTLGNMLKNKPILLKTYCWPARPPKPWRRCSAPAPRHRARRRLPPLGPGPRRCRGRARRLARNSGLP